MTASKEPKKVLITGGAGFLGSHLIDRLLQSGDHVICVDNLFTGSTSNIAHHSRNSKFQFIEHDVLHPLSVEVDEIYKAEDPIETSIAIR